MSGGSFDYLYYKEVDELFEMGDTIQRMADELAKLGYARDVAKDTQEVLQEFRVFRNRLEVAIERLRPVWESMERWRSGDDGEEEFKDVLETYRGR